MVMFQSRCSSNGREFKMQIAGYIGSYRKLWCNDLFGEEAFCKTMDCNHCFVNEAFPQIDLDPRIDVGPMIKISNRVYLIAKDMRVK